MIELSSSINSLRNFSSLARESYSDLKTSFSQTKSKDLVKAAALSLSLISLYAFQSSSAQTQVQGQGLQANLSNAPPFSNQSNYCSADDAPTLIDIFKAVEIPSQALNNPGLVEPQISLVNPPTPKLPSNQSNYCSAADAPTLINSFKVVEIPSQTLNNPGLVEPQISLVNLLTPQLLSNQSNYCSAEDAPQLIDSFKAVKILPKELKNPSGDALDKLDTTIQKKEVPISPFALSRAQKRIKGEIKEPSYEGGFQPAAGARSCYSLDSLPEGLSEPIELSCAEDKYAGDITTETCHYIIPFKISNADTIIRVVNSLNTMIGYQEDQSIYLEQIKPIKGGRQLRNFIRDPQPRFIYYYATQLFQHFFTSYNSNCIDSANGENRTIYYEGGNGTDTTDKLISPRGEWVMGATKDVYIIPGKNMPTIHLGITKEGHNVKALNRCLQEKPITGFLSGFGTTSVAEFATLNQLRRVGYLNTLTKYINGCFNQSYLTLDELSLKKTGMTLGEKSRKEGTQAAFDAVKIIGAVGGVIFGFSRAAEMLSNRLKGRDDD